MIKVSKDNLERSEVLVEEGEDTQSNIRTSFGFWPDSDEVTDRITVRLVGGGREGRGGWQLVVEGGGLASCCWHAVQLLGELLGEGTPAHAVR